MSITVDANLLLYASDTSSTFHPRAADLLTRLADGPEIVYLFWPTIMAYLRISTHPSVFARPLAASEAIGNIDQLLNRPHIRTPSEGEAFWSRYKDLAADVTPSGNLVPDAHVAALMVEHGVGTIWTRDRDFRKFRGIRVLDPFE